MIKILGNFECSRCNKPFMSYLYGHYLFDDGHDNGICFVDNTLGEIHDNSYVYPIRGKRLCRKCRKGIDLLSF